MPPNATKHGESVRDVFGEVPNSETGIGKGKIHEEDDPVRVFGTFGDFLEDEEEKNTPASVVNVGSWPKEARVYVGRSKRYGGPHYFANPFKIGEDGDLPEVLRRFEENLYRELLTTDEGLLELEKLEAQVRSGKSLACHCAGKNGAPDVLTAEGTIFCHGQILLRAMDGELDNEGVQGVPLLDDEGEV